jgi:hypothetical protein
MRKYFLILVVGLVACAATPALAQSPRSNRPYRGLFGGGVGSTEQLLTATVNTSAGYDDDVLLASGGNNRPTPGNTTASTIGSVSGGLSYSLSKAKAAFSAGYNGSVSFYPWLNDPSYQDHYVSHSASGGGSYELSNRTRFSGGASISFQPLYYLVEFPAMADPIADVPVMTDPSIPESALPAPVPPAPVSTDPVLGVRSVNYISTGASVGLSHAFSRRISSSLGYSASRSPTGTYGAYVGQSVSGGISWTVAKGMSVHGGYTYGQNEYGTGADRLLYETQQVDAGLGFARALSLTRRTSLSFDTGTSILKDKNSTHFGIVGNIGITREIGRTWAATAGYHRNVSFMRTFNQPVFSDSFSAGVGGMINRRLQFQAGFGTALGKVGFGVGDTGFSNFYTSAGLRYGISQNIGLTADYGYYWYDYGTDVTLPKGVPSKIGRQSVHVGISYWTTIFQQARRSHASR